MISRSDESYTGSVCSPQKSLGNFDISAKWKQWIEVSLNMSECLKEFGKLVSSVTERIWKFVKDFITSK